MPRQSLVNRLRRTRPTRRAGAAGPVRGYAAPSSCSGGHVDQAAHEAAGPTTVERRAATPVAGAVAGTLGVTLLGLPAGQLVAVLLVFVVICSLGVAVPVAYALLGGQGRASRWVPSRRVSWPTTPSWSRWHCSCWLASRR